MGWTLAPALGAFRDELDALRPHRDRTSDGTIGDAAHAASSSDHNPNAAGVVRAFDVDVDLLGAGDNHQFIVVIFDYLRGLGKAGDRRLKGGYLILNDMFAGASTGWEPVPYDDDGNPSTWHDPHTSHLHFSIATDPHGYNDRSSWGLSALFPQEDAMTPELKSYIDAKFNELARSMVSHFDSMGRTLLGELDAQGNAKDPTHLSNAVIITEIRKERTP